MSNSEKNLQQEKYDAWFASLQLNTPASLNRKERVYRWSRRNMYWITPVFVLILPIIIYIILTLIERKTNLFSLCGFTKNEWFLFFGSYLGGVATLIGVILTILHTKKSQSRQEKIASIEKEYEAQAHFLIKINIPHFCSMTHKEFEKIPFSGEIHHLVKVQEVLSSISRHQEEIMQEMIRIGTSSDIFAREIPCEGCHQYCNKYRIKKEFRNIFESEYQKNIILMQRLQNIFNTKYYIHNIMIFLKSNTNINQQEESNYCDKIKNDIDRIRNEYNLLSNDIQEQSMKWHSEQFGKLITLIRFYKDEQIKAINRPCPYKQRTF